MHSCKAADALCPLLDGEKKFLNHAGELSNEGLLSECVKYPIINICELQYFFINIMSKYPLSSVPCHCWLGIGKSSSVGL